MRSYIKPLPDRRSILIKDASILITETGVLKNRSIYVSEGVIRAIGETSEISSKFGRAELTVDASNSIVMPGLINNHSHIAMSLLRGYAEDLPLLSWLKDKVWPAEGKLTFEDFYLGATAGCAESLLEGTTSITSVYFYDSLGSEAEAALDMGIRGIFAHGIFDWTRETALRRTNEMVQSFHGKDRGRIRIATSPHAPYSCSPELLKEIEQLRADLNSKYGVRYRVMNTLHVAEARTEPQEIESNYGVSVKQGVPTYLDKLGVLNSETICAHCIHLTESDIQALKKTKASVASCPVSNLKVGMGAPDLPRLLDNDICVSLGTDGPASNNTLDMFETLKMASLLSKGLGGDASLMGAQESFLSATMGGARSMNQESEIGSLATGKRADIVMLDISSVRGSPLYDPFSHIAYSARAGDVRNVIVDGRLLVKDGEVLTVDLQLLKKSLEKRAIDLGFAS